MDLLLTVVAKAAAPSFETLSDRAARELASAIYDLLKSLPSTDWTKSIAKLVADGRWAEAANQIENAPYPPARYRDLLEAIAKVISDGVKLEVDIIPPLPTPGIVPSDFLIMLPSAARAGAILADPNAIRAVQSYSFGLIRAFEDSVRDGIKVTINEGLARGDNPRATAVAVRKIVGLTENQVRAVDRFRAELDGWHERKSAATWGLGQKTNRAPGGAQVVGVDSQGRPLDQVGARRLRDFRYDRTLQASLATGKPLSDDQKDKMIEAYTRKMLKFRSETIARSEAIRALNAGKFEAWKAEISAGRIDGSLVFKRWEVAAGERTCAICKGIAAEFNRRNHGQGLQLDERFDVRQLAGRPGVRGSQILSALSAPNYANASRPGQEVHTDQGLLYPPVHPDCRCTLIVRLVTPRMINRAA